MKIREAIQQHGLEFLKGKPVRIGQRIMFIHDDCINKDIDLYADEPENASQIRRFYGSEVRNDPLLCEWIYRNQELIELAEVAYISVWDGGAKITSKGTVNLMTGEVVAEQVDVDGMDLEIHEGDFVEVGGTRFTVSCNEDDNTYHVDDLAAFVAAFAKDANARA